MDCADVRAALSAGKLPAGPDAAAHLSSCAACALLVEAPGLARTLTQAERAPVDDVTALLSRTLGDVDAERGIAAKMRSLSTPVRIAIAIAIATAVPLVVLVVMPRADLGALPRGRFALDVLLYALPAVAALAIALWPMQRTVSTRTRALVALCAVLGAVCVAALPPLHGDHAGALVGEGSFVRLALGCLAFGTITAAPAFVILRLLAREGGHVGTKAFVLGLAAALSGSAAVFVHCAITHPPHLWAGHVTVLVPAAIWALWHARGRL